MWAFMDEEIVKLQNRINDVWEESTNEDNYDRFTAATERLLGALDMLISVDHYYRNTKEK